MICVIIGQRKAAVLPLPVFAKPMTSLPDRTAGIPCACSKSGHSNALLTVNVDISFVTCIGVGCVNSDFLMALRSGSSKPK